MNHTLSEYSLSFAIYSFQFKLKIEKRCQFFILLITFGTAVTVLGHREESLRRKSKTEIFNQFLTSVFCCFCCCCFCQIKFINRNPVVFKIAIGYR